MKLWLVCFFALFFGAESIQWFSQLHWFSGVELSLPMVLVGGAGLAIASNYRYLQSLGLFPEPASRLSSPASPQPPTSLESSKPASACDQLGATTAARDPQSGQTGPSGQVPVPDKSISFKIHKPPRSR
jgi:hypothetical protein